MKNMLKKGILFCVVVLCGALLFAGGSKDSSKSMLKVGVVQLVEHVALDASYRGFIDGLAEGGYVNGQNVKIDFQNAQGEQANCVTIANKLINDKSALILAITTPAAQAVANLTSAIPILITAVTDPESAKLVKSNALPGTNVTGTSDLTPVAAQIRLIKEILPGAKTIGLLYCSSEQNSKFQIDIAKTACQENGFAFIEATVSNSNEIQQVTQSLVGKVDALYVPTDNMIAAGMPTVAMVANSAKTPIFCGEEGMVNNGGFATYGINYYELGKLTGKMAVDILKNGKKPAEMPIQYVEKFDFTVNEQVAKELGIIVPAGLGK
ncbi:MAG: ABC transporter substrate-binding protein [Treponema sp.]|jgi:putative ABC transport system substrate-binding protein|nr:ABC transporter substrate-binding protein [Treponema sp.]